MKIVQYIISILLVTNLIKLFPLHTTTINFEWYWNLFTGLVGVAYLIILIITQFKKL